MHKLKSYKITGKLYNWIEAWLSGRTQSVKLDNLFSSFKAVLSGILQGSVLGPLLFLIFINDLCDNIPDEAHPTLFADDLKLFSDDISNHSSSSSHLYLLPCFKMQSILLIHGHSYGSFLYLFLSVSSCLYLTQNLSNLASILSMALLFLRPHHVLI